MPPIGVTRPYAGCGAVTCSLSSLVLNMAFEAEPGWPQASESERRFVLYGVPWRAYVALRDALDDHAGLKMTYLEGTLELMSPSMLHEDAKLGKLEEDGVPDVAVEVIVSSALVDKMAVYAGLGVPEVWEWRPGTGTISVHRLVEGHYERRERSVALPELDLALLARFVQPGENQTRPAKAYQTALRSH